MPAPATPQTEAQLIEIFSSIQGEGVLVGSRQVFLRLASCNLSCSYCDTEITAGDTCRVETAPGSMEFSTLANPVAFKTVYELLQEWSLKLPGVHQHLSVTGGEPLQQGEILQEWLPGLRELMPIYLETNGTLPEALRPLLKYIDFVSMDIKLFSETGRPTQWKIHREFLSLIAGMQGQVKMVVGEQTTAKEIEIAAFLLRDQGTELPLILQPVTRNGEITVSAAKLMALQGAAARVYPHIRVIPQTHRLTRML